MNGTWTCAQCGEVHGGMFDIGAAAPDPWGRADHIESNSALRFDGDFLSDDFCVIGGEHFLVRCVLEIPVHGMADPFGFGLWSSLSRENFDLYVDGFDSGHDAGLGPWTGWLCNQAADYVGTEPLPLWVEPQPSRQRPRLFVADEQHPLAIAQEQGISPERVLEIYAFYGHGPG